MSAHKNKDNRDKEEHEKPAEGAAASAGAGGAVPDKSGEKGAEARKVTAEEYDKAVRERDEFLDLARRARADYQNLQRRVDAQIPAARAEAEQRFALDMIAIMDDLERALDHIRKGQDAEAVIKGITLVRENFLDALAGYGITPIDADGVRFDHGLHHAIAEQPTDSAEPGTVVAVAQRGYLAKGKLLRPAQVVVASALAEAPEARRTNGSEPPDRDAGGPLE